LEGNKVDCLTPQALDLDQLVPTIYVDGAVEPGLNLVPPERPLPSSSTLMAPHVPTGISHRKE
jgi:hypothetical protein